MHTYHEKNIFIILISFTLVLLMLTLALLALTSSATFVMADFLLTAIPVLSVGAGAAYFLAFKINQRFVQTYRAMSELVEGTEDIVRGNFDKRLVSDQSAQSHQLAKVLNAFVEKMAAIIKRVRSGATDLTQTADTLKEAYAGIAENSNDVDCRLALTVTTSEHIAFNVNTMVSSIEEASSNVSSVSASVYQLSTNINTVAASAEEASTNMVGINHSFDRISQDINTVASSAEKMSVSMSEIAKNAQNAMRISADATNSAQETLSTMNQLSETAKKIGRVVKLIDSIAGQTNMLALNATIEAASAGEAGKGFAVVAGEIKDLAQQTAEANNEIADQIEQIQNYAAEALKHTQAVNTIIHKVAEINQAIDFSVEQQSSSADTITEAVDGIANASKESVLNLQEATKGLKEITRSAAEASQASRSSARALEETAAGVKEAAHSSTEVSGGIKKIISNLHSARGTLKKITLELSTNQKNLNDFSHLTHELTQSVHSFNMKESFAPGYGFSNSYKSSNNPSHTSTPQPHSRIESKKTLVQDDETPLILWDLAVYSVGIKEIDRQHSILAELINRLDHGVKHQISQETIIDILNYLADYTVFHFGYEEKLLAEHQWAELDSHKAIHATFVNKVHEFQSQLQFKEAHELAESILTFLKDWLVDHILKTDKHYGAALNAKGVY